MTGVEILGELGEGLPRVYGQTPTRQHTHQETALWRLVLVEQDSITEGGGSNLLVKALEPRRARRGRALGTSWSNLLAGLPR